MVQWRRDLHDPACVRLRVPAVPNEVAAARTPSSICSVTASSLTAATIANIPPVVTTRSPFLSSCSIDSRFFRALRSGAIITK